MQWDYWATIGFKVDDGFFVNNDPSSTDVACLNYPKSEYSNLVFLLSSESPEVPLPGKCFLSVLLDCDIYLLSTTWNRYGNYINNSKLSHCYVENTKFHNTGAVLCSVW